MFSVDVDEVRRRAEELTETGRSLTRVMNSLGGIDVSDFMRDATAQRIQKYIDLMEHAVEIDQQQIWTFAQVLRAVADTYVKAEEDAQSKLPRDQGNTQPKKRTGNLADGSAVFDDKGGYGGDQGDMAYNKPDKQLYDAVRMYEGYENYTDSQIEDLFRKINSEGCGYVAIINSIFLQYEADPQLFERIFGFPMFDGRGEFNFNRLLIDFYCTTDNKFYMDEAGGPDALAVDVLNSYKDHPQDFVAEYGMEPFADENHYNTAAMQAVIDRYQDKGVVSYDTQGTTVRSLKHRMDHYLNEKGIDHTCETIAGNTSVDDVRKGLESGKSVNVAVGGFNMYDSNGNMVAEDVGGHWMTVTGVTEDGNYIVSSWGKQYILHANELDGVDLLVMDI